jgi:hypothetical protein
MSLLSIILAVVLVVAAVCWVTGYRLPRLPGPSRTHRRTSGVSRSTQQQLMRLVNGNRHVADRLVARVRAQHPDRSDQWCWEKAIYDLERDRRV